MAVLAKMIRSYSPLILGRGTVVRKRLHFCIVGTIICAPSVGWEMIMMCLWNTFSIKRNFRRGGRHGSFIITIRHRKIYDRGGDWLCYRENNCHCAETSWYEVCPSNLTVDCRSFVHHTGMISPLWEMVQEGIDISTIDWSQHWRHDLHEIYSRFCVSCCRGTQDILSCEAQCPFSALFPPSYLTSRLFVVNVA